MSHREVFLLCLGGLIGVSAGLSYQVHASDPVSSVAVDIAISDSERSVRFTPYPGAVDYRVLRSRDIRGPFSEVNSGSLLGYEWFEPINATSPLGFFRVQVTPIERDELFVSTLLNRLAYGPTPDEVDRVMLIGPEAYIEEQLAPEAIDEMLEIDVVSTPSGWQYIEATGRGSSSTVYVYLTNPGEGYIDDLKLVAGSIAERRVDRIKDGGFESALDTDQWTVSDNHSDSTVTSDVKYSGSSSLRLVAASGGTTKGSAIWRELTPELSSSGTYTLSFWYLPNPEKLSGVTVRLSGSGIVASSPSLTPMTKLVRRIADIDDLQAWYAQHAMGSKRQLLETLTQFVDNHFTTYFEKSRDFLNGKLEERTERMMATDLEFRELAKWREVLMNPNGTFYDLLRISTESPAMIIYLDTVTNTKEAPNENYARELMELFTMGVDNGYDQRDIEEMSRAWTGWRVEKLPVGQEGNPYARRVNDRDKDPGIWSLQYSRADHDIDAKTIFPLKTVDQRFGAPHAGESYELKIPMRGPSQGLEDGYDIIEHLADLPYTQEYISVKLCRLFVHENFVHGIYDYTDPDLSAEAELIRDCMTAWDAPAQDGRQGNLRNVLRVVFESPLFSEHAASRQKVKTPFEFTVSVVRSIRTPKANGEYTASSSGSDLLAPMERMGQELFHREDPDGWSEFGVDWINTSALVERMRFVQSFLKAGSSKSDPVGLLKQRIPTSQWRDSTTVVRFFCDVLFLGEGSGNLYLDRAAAIAFLNTHENGVSNSPFNRLDPSSSAYDTRVRGMVAMLMGLPRFQEQ